MSQRSNSSRLSDRSKTSSKKGSIPVFNKKKDVKMQIKTTDIRKVP